MYVCMYKCRHASTYTNVHSMHAYTPFLTIRLLIKLHMYVAHTVDLENFGVKKCV